MTPIQQAHYDEQKEALEKKLIEDLAQLDREHRRRLRLIRLGLLAAYSLIILIPLTAILVTLFRR